MPEDASLLILGLGNVLCRDDGLGVAAIQRLQRTHEAPTGVHVLDGGTLGLSLLPCMQDADQIILVDAIATDEAPGTPVRLEGHDVGAAVRHRLSPHQIGVADLIDALCLVGRRQARLVLVGVVPESIGLGFGLSPPVEAALPHLVERIIDEASALGYRLAPKISPREGSTWS